MSAKDLLKDIEKFSAKDKLKSVSTVVTKSDGQRFTETKTSTGQYTSVSHDEKVLGFCPDLRPDPSVGIVLPSIYVASQDVAYDKAALDRLGITHVLNVAIQLRNAFTSSDYVYCNVPMYDEEDEVIMKYYETCANFIDEALKNKGTILVHCRAGKSRSVSICVAYMMHKDNTLTVEQCLDKIRQTKPNIDPNKGFLAQLKELELKLSQK